MLIWENSLRRKLWRKDFQEPLFYCRFRFFAAACGSYEPKREYFELSVRLEKSEAEIGEQIPYTIELVRKSGVAFACKGSSTLCGVYFDIATPEKEPYFVYTDDIVTNRFSRDYRWKESGSLETADKQAAFIFLPSVFPSERWSMILNGKSF